MKQESLQREKPGPLLRMLLPMMRWLRPNIITPLHVRLYPLLGGRRVGGSRLLLTTVGRRSGQPRKVIVACLRDGDNVIVNDVPLARPALPSWVLNLRAHPQAEVRLGLARYQARAEPLEGEERAGHWGRLVARDPTIDKFQRLAGREIAVIRLRLMMPNRS